VTVDSAVRPEGPDTPDESSLLMLTTGRVEAFSDCVISVAATLLVLDIKEPPPGDNVWLYLSAYSVSFLTILIFWINHHSLFHSIHHVDRALLFLNGLLLLGISFISYSTAVLGHALEANHYDKSAAALYALVLGLASACFNGLWGYLASRPQLLVPAAREWARAAFLRSLTGPALYTVAGLAALLDARVSLAVDAVVALYFAVLPRHLRRIGRRVVDL